MSNDENPTFLRQQFEVLIGAYGWPERPGQFAAWETWLADFPQWAVGTVVLAAPDLWPQKMPEVGILRSKIIETIERRKREERELEKMRNPPAIPEGPSVQNCPPDFLEMCAEWEKEDRERPGGASYDVGLSRLKQINALWAKREPKTMSGEQVAIDPTTTQHKGNPEE